MFGRDRDDTIKTPLFIAAACVLAGLVAGVALVRLVITPYAVSDDSMRPGLAAGDRIYVLKWGAVRWGDRVLFASPIEPDRVLLKRVIGVEGDTIEVSGKAIYRNGAKLSAPWNTVSTDRRIFPMSFTGRDNSPTVRIGRGELYVVGDNLDRSMDSRTFGPVRMKSVIGTVLGRR